MTMTVDLGHAARLWHERGWPIFPLPAGAKAPPPDGVTGAAGVNLTAAQIAATSWVGNIGVRTPEEVIGIDVDAYDGKPGAETLARLEAQLGPLPVTVISSNGRPGPSGNRLLRVPVGMRWIAGLPGIEIIQPRHRYFAAWPSMHPEGRQYVLIDELSGEPRDVPWVDDLPDLPWPWINALSRPTDDDVGHPVVAVTEAKGSAFLDEHHAAEAPGYLTNVIVAHFNDRVDAGNSRHDAMQHCLTWAMESAAAGICSAEAALRELAAAWSPRHTDARRAELFNPRRVTEFDAMARHAIGKALAKTPAELAEIHDKTCGPRFEVGPQPEAPPAEPEGSSLYVDWRRLWADDGDGHEWLVDGFWPAKRAMALWAPAKTGKSELALWVAVQLALGRDPFTGAVIEPVEVAYFDFEMTEDDLRERLGAFGLYGTELAHLHYAVLPPLPALDLDAGGQALTDHVVAVGARVVVIDTFGRAVTGAEDEADTVRAFYRYTGARLKQLGIAYLRTDHAGKDVTKGQRGSSAKRDDVDIIWLAQQTKAGLALDCAGSSRLSWVGPRLDVERHVRASGIVYRTAPTASIVMLTEAVLGRVAELDALGIPDGWGRGKVIEELERHNRGPGHTTALADAIRYRKTRPKAAKPVPEQVENDGTGSTDGTA